MATVNYTTTNSYVQVTEVGTATDFLMQSLHNSRGVDVVFAGSAPGSTDPSHFLRPGETMIRAGVSGNVYVRSHDTDEPVVLAISAGA